MEIKANIDPKDYPIGVIMARFQVHKLHEGHIKLINKVCENHKKVIIFLGVPQIENTKENPLDFASRKAMIQDLYPQVVVMPHKDQRSDEVWSQKLDDEIRMPYGNLKALLYGSRDSFIPHYLGKYDVVELVTDVFYSGTEVRKQVSREVLSSSDFRAGVIHATYAVWPITYPTVDVVAYNDEGQILLAKKPNEKLYRFIGGFTDRSDNSYEEAAKREFMEETGGCEIADLTFVASGKINDWRYAKTDCGIMTTLFVGKFVFGRINPSDDISELAWKNTNELTIEDIMPEHRDLYTKLTWYLHFKKICVATPLVKA